MFALALAWNALGIRSPTRLPCDPQPVLTGEEGSEDDDEDDAETGDDDDAAGRTGKDAAAEAERPPRSKHERRQAALAARIAALEAANMAEKDWFMRGEAKAGKLTSSTDILLHANKMLRARGAQAAKSASRDSPARCMAGSVTVVLISLA